MKILNSSKDTRAPLQRDTVIALKNAREGERLTVNTTVSSLPDSIKYLAMSRDKSGSVSGVVILKELFPKSPDLYSLERNADGGILCTDVDGNVGCDVSSLFLTGLIREKEMCDRARKGDGLKFVPEVTGPVADENGGCYLITRLPQRARFFGAYLSDDKRDGFGRSESLSDIIDLLVLLCQRMAIIHKKNGILHLGLSHSNIYCTTSTKTGETEIYITDFSNAVRLSESGVAADDSYDEDVSLVANEYSAPELYALSAIEPFMRHGSGYTLGAYSDTYSVCAMLYKAVMGKGHSGFSASELRESLCKMYPRTAYFDLARCLYSLLVMGLSPVPAERFSDFESLEAALCEIKTALLGRSAISALSPIEALPYLLYSEHPLYDAADKEGNIRILLAGTPERVLPYVRAAASTGQMAKGRLEAYILTDKEKRMKELLSEEMPSLYNGKGGCDIIGISLLGCKSISEIPEKANERLCGIKYAVIDLENESEAYKAAEAVLSALSCDGKKPRVLSHTSLSDVKEAKRTLPAGVIPFGESLEAYGKAASDISGVAARMDLFLENLGGERISLKKRERDFRVSVRAQSLALALAVHTKYKLKSIGINPKKDEQTLAALYTEKLRDEATLGTLIELCHRHRAAYYMARGYTAPSYSDFDTYAYRFEGMYFNGSLDCESKRLMRTLVPCGRGTRSILETVDLSLIRCEADIESLSLDELDKMSLYSYLYLKGRAERSEERNGIATRFSDAVNSAISRAARDKAPSLTAVTEQLLSKLLPCMKRGELCGIEEELSYLGKVFRDESVNISEPIRRLKCELSVFGDSKSLCDLKRTDRLLARMLHIIMLEERISLIKPESRMKIDNVAASLILRPEVLVILGTDDTENYRSFLSGRGMDTRVIGDVPEALSAKGLSEHIAAVCESLSGRIVIDITGSAPLYTAAAMMLAAERSDVSIIRCDESTQCIENVCGPELSPIYSTSYEISARESYGLFGAREKRDNEEDYLEEMGDLIPDVWKIYLEHRERWDRLVFFLAGCERDEMYATNIPLGNASETTKFVKKVTAGVLEKSGIEPILRILAGKRAISRLSVDRSFAGFATISFEAPADRPAFTSRLELLFDRLYEQKLDYTVTEPFDGRGSIMNITATSGRYVRADSTKIKALPYKEVMPILYSLEEKGIVFITKDPGVSDNPGELEFISLRPSVTKMLMKAGNVLEAYVWYAAKRSGYFDDVRANFKFTWTDPDVSNELDVILTKGLSSVVISCKTTNKTENMHLYEIKYLTEHFTVNSRAVIVYAIDNQAQLESMEKRAAAMGISVISLADLSSTERLTKRLCEIAETGR